ncbi:MAG TPA: DUF1592 domain-containing protein [Vicinamibacterales bacterium]|jgi:hypothetical protein
MARRWVGSLTGLLLGVFASSLPAFAQRATINQYCVGCHNERSKAAGLAFDTLDLENVPANAEVLEKVVRRLRARTMPPSGRPRPDDSTYRQTISSLEAALDRAAGTNPHPGRTDTFRRLNRAEYQNAIRDLLAVDVDVSSLLPRDDASHGFDNVGGGGLSPTLLERYLAAAQKVSRLAVGSPVPSPASHVVVLPADLTQEDHAEGLPFGTRGGTLVRHTFPLNGVYEVEIRLSRDRNENVEGLTEPHDVELTLDGRRIQLFTVRPNRNQMGIYYADEAVDKHLKVRVPVEAGPHALGVTFPRKTFALPETERQPYKAHFNMDRHPRIQPAVRSVAIAGPFDPTGVAETPSRRRIFTCHPTRTANRSVDDTGCAKTIIATLARRAYRRPVTDADIEAPLAFFKVAQAEEGFEAGIELALRAILASTEFLFRIERDPGSVAPNMPYRISDVELASRLSFFLWSSIPDDELLTAAAGGKLSAPGGLERQVQRMLNDQRSEALVTNFAGQWLYLRNLAASSPDPRTFPDFDDNLRQAFRRETELFFESIVKEDRSVLDLLRANYTFVNERLARHYGIPNVYGSRFRRVTLDDNGVRGGLLGHGSILTVTSYANRTSPVLRGKWIMENLLGTQPPPPPENVPPLTDNPVGRMLSMRERMTIHRANPACASCHQLIDPAGLSLEHFDAIGRWRTRSEAGTPIDASGGLPDGTTFEGASGLRQALLARPELVVGTTVEKLLTYALGRGLDHHDAPAVRKITREAAGHDYRFSSLILGIVGSTPFRMRMKGDDTNEGSKVPGFQGSRVRNGEPENPRTLEP